MPRPESVPEVISLMLSRGPVLHQFAPGKPDVQTGGTSSFQRDSPWWVITAEGDHRVVTSEKPSLVVVIDTEEEFDWSKPFSRANTSIYSLRLIARIQSLSDEYGIKPVYMVDYPVVSQPEGYRLLQELHQSGRCVIGAHLHPWVNPPFDEPVNHTNSFPGNLPRALEAAKLRVLTEAIGERFGCRPVVYKAGRYGLGPNTAGILEEQEYEVDLSVCPHMDYSVEGGPDFTGITAWPFWFGKTRRLLELPLTVGFAGCLRRWGERVHGIACKPGLLRLRTPAILSRLGLIDKIWLSPEGYTSSEHRNLVKALLADGLRVFSFALHSPSLEPGHTPYVRSEADLERFLSRCRRLLDFFMGELGGVPTTPLKIREQFLRSMSVTREAEHARARDFSA